MSLGRRLLGAAALISVFWHRPARLNATPAHPPDDRDLPRFSDERDVAIERWAVGAPPQRLAANPPHPWFHPYWSRNAAVMIDGHRLRGVQTVDAIEGWADVMTLPLSYDPATDSLRVSRVRGAIAIVPASVYDE